MSHPLNDPIAHAWQQCNPHAPLPRTLVRNAAPSGLTVSLYLSQLVAEWSATTQEARKGLVTVATLPLVSLPDEGVQVEEIAV